MQSVSSIKLDVRSCPSADPEEILRQQQAIRLQVQGGEGRETEYSTYDQDVAHLQARFQHVDVSCRFLAFYSLLFII